jgi:hypothetical protein
MHLSGGRHPYACMLFLLMMLDCALAPGSAKAIPLSGEYMFVTGDPNISGTLPVPALHCRNGHLVQIFLIACF